MIDFLITYWLAALPTAVTGVLLLGMLKKMRDEKARKEKALVPVAARRKQQG
jgi:hypothetical protein